MQTDSDVFSDLQDRINKVKINNWSDINCRYATLGKDTLTINRLKFSILKLNNLLVVYHVAENIAEKILKEYSKLND